MASRWATVGKPLREHLSDGRRRYKIPIDYHGVAEQIAPWEAKPDIFHNLVGAAQAMTIETNHILYSPLRPTTHFVSGPFTTHEN